VRALVAPNGTITEVWHYDSWGNPISPPAQRIEQPFLWNGAYGYEYIPFTGLYHIGAREYDPRTARYLQRQGSNPTNPYIAQENDPINNIDENLSLGGTQGLLQRGLPKDQQQQLVGTLKASGQFVAELHPGVSAFALYFQFLPAQLLQACNHRRTQRSHILIITTRHQTTLHTTPHRLHQVQMRTITR